MGSTSKPLGGITSLTLGVISSTGVAPTLQESGVEIPLLEDRSTYTETVEWTGTTKSVKQSLRLYTSINYALPTELYDGFDNGFIAEVSLNSSDQMIVGWDEESQSYRKLLLVSCVTDCGEKPASRGYKEWLFESEEPEEEITPEEPEEEEEEITPDPLVGIATIALAVTSDVLPQESVEIPLLDDMSTFTQTTEWIDEESSIKQTLKIYTTVEYELPEGLEEGLNEGFIAFIDLNSDDQIIAGWSDEEQLIPLLRLTSCTVECGEDSNSKTYKKWLFESEEPEEEVTPEEPEEEEEEITPDPLVGIATIALAVTSDVLPQESVEIPLLDDMSTFTQTTEWIDEESSIKQTLKIYTTVEYELPEGLEEGLNEGFIAFIDLNSDDQIIAGWSDEEQLIPLLRLTSCTVECGEDSNSKTYKKWLFESEEPEEEITPEEPEEEEEEITPDPLVGIATIALAVTSDLLPQESIEIPLLDDMSTFTQTTEWLEEQSSIKQTLKIYTTVEYELPEGLEEGLSEGFIAFIDLNSDDQIIAGWSDEEQLIPLLRLTSCTVECGEDSNSKTYKKWLFESEEPEEEVTPEEPEEEEEEAEESPNGILSLMLGVASATGEAPTFPTDGVAIELLDDLSTYTENVEFMGAMLSVEHSLKFYTTVDFTLPSTLTEGLTQGFVALVELNTGDKISVGWSALALSDRPLRLVSCSTESGQKASTTYYKEWLMESIDGASNI